jgi:hypothetical protein
MRITDWNKEELETGCNIIFDIPGTHTSILDRMSKYEIEEMIEDLQKILEYIGE